MHSCSSSYFFTSLPAVNTRKSIKIAIRILLVLGVLVFLVLILGDFAINRYINADGRRDLSKYLPINGTATYNRVSIHPFRDFPHLSLKMKGLKVADSLAEEHGFSPLLLDELNVSVSVVDWRKKQIAIEAIDLEGLTVNIFDASNGYSNIANLIKRKVINTTSEKKKGGISVVSKNTSLSISNVDLNKIDKRSGQQAHVTIDALNIENAYIDKGDMYELSVGLNQIIVSDFPVKENNENPIHLSRAIAKVELDRTFSKLTLHEFLLSNGHIHLYNDSLGHSNYANLFGDKKKTSINNNTKKDGLSLAIHGANIQIEDIDFAMINHAKNKHLEARIVKIETEIQAPEDGSDTTAVFDIELDVGQLAFNTTKGAFLSKSLVKGKVNTEFSRGRIGLTSPSLKINEELFNLKANIYSDQKTATTLTVEKKDARTSPIRPLLTRTIQKSIAEHEVEGSFYAKADIYFTPGKKDPRVEVDLKVDNKTVTAKDQTLLNATVSATFINRLHDDSRQFSEGRKNVRFMVHRLSGEFNELQIETQNALFTSTPSGDRIVAKAEITGQAASASQYLKHDNFFFEEGEFTLTTEIDGSPNNLDDLIAGTNLNLKMEDLEVHYPAGNTIIPLNVLELKKDGEKTIFEIEGFTSIDRRPFRIRGEVDRISSLYFPDRGYDMATVANIRANSISWEGVIALFGKEGIFSNTKPIDQKEAKRSMKQTLAGIQQSFQPIINIVIDTLFYSSDIQLLDFQSGLKFNDERTLVLKETSFKLEQANVTLDGELKINELDFTKFDFDIELNKLDFDVLLPKFDYFGVHLFKQIHDQPDNLSMKIKLSGELDDLAGLQPESINADMIYESFAENKFSGRLQLKANPSTKRVNVIFGHSGHPRNLNNILNTDAYRFDEGYFTISFQFDDNFETVAQMVEESIFNLSVDDAELYVTELGVTVPLTRIEVASIKNNAYYHLLLRSDSLKQELAFNGVVNNIRHFAFKDTDDPYQVELEISSPRIVWDDLKKVITYQQQNGEQVPNGKAIKESLTKVLNDFNPNVKLKIDTLEYSDKLNFKDIHAHAYLDSSILKIDSAVVSYGESQIYALLDADMNHDDILPFKMQLQMANIDISHTLEHFDYFDFTQLREAKQIDGNIWFDLDMEAEMDLKNKGLNTEKTKADISVELLDLVIEGLHTIDTITQKFKMESRFKDLRFAPIQSQIKVTGKRLEIQQTEFQSNAVHAFVEGTLDEQSPENLWISIPLSNIKSRDLNANPEKTGDALAGRKIYLEWISSEDKNNGKMKLRFSKKKFFKQRSTLKEFRAYKRSHRKERKKFRKERRKNSNPLF